ncbi:hypothetical protein DOTSEDRAFT_39668 [Dothistroma septosporum NZE10]|uniref:Uncharacterized protein n=1 Tax=Dothistroma septosporum (strain NZE10 / CBS 128990) TaxID=675120 RepID=M2XGD7_DOTSN|nr:hypothetical protein DOTSEDRAFT_39668 [Dothistroma septosporum NZE10]
MCQEQFLQRRATAASADVTSDDGHDAEVDEEPGNESGEEPENVGTSLVSAQVEAVQDMLSMMAQIQRALSMQAGTEQDVLICRADENESFVLVSDDDTIGGVVECGESDMSIDEDNAEAAKDLDQDGEEEQDLPFHAMMVLTTIYHMQQPLHQGRSVWEEEMGDLRCPYYRADIYPGCVDGYERSNEDYETVETAHTALLSAPQLCASALCSRCFLPDIHLETVRDSAISDPTLVSEDQTSAFVAESGLDTLRIPSHTLTLPAPGSVKPMMDEAGAYVERGANEGMLVLSQKDRSDRVAGFPTHLMLKTLDVDVTAIDCVRDEAKDVAWQQLIPTSAECPLLAPKQILQPGPTYNAFERTIAASMAPARGARKGRPLSAAISPWTDDERRGLKILFQHPNILNPDNDANRDILQRIFAQTFPVKRRKSYAHLYDQYQPRLTISKRTGKPERSQRWFEIDRPNVLNNTPYTQEEIDEFTRVEADLQNAAIALGIPWTAPPAMQITPVGASVAQVTAAGPAAVSERDDDTVREAEAVNEESRESPDQDHPMEDVVPQQQESQEEEQLQNDAMQALVPAIRDTPASITSQRIALYTSSVGTNLSVSIAFDLSSVAQGTSFYEPHTPKQWLPYLHVRHDCVWDGARAAYRASRNKIVSHFTPPVVGIPACAERFLVQQRIYLDDDTEWTLVVLCRVESCKYCAIAV